MNTKITFYVTSFEQGSFYKTVFDTIIGGELDDDEAYEWEEGNINELVNEFNFTLIFDRVIIERSFTNEPTHNAQSIKNIKGSLDFTEHVKSQKTDESSSTIITSSRRHYDILRSETQNQMLVLSERELELLRRENDLLRRDIELRKKQLLLDSEDTTEKEKDASCWIDRDGVRYDVAFSGHNEFAQEKLIEILGKKYKDHHSRYPYEQLQDRGWIRILGWTNPTGFVIPDRITPAQKQQFLIIAQMKE